MNTLKQECNASKVLLIGSDSHRHTSDIFEVFSDGRVFGSPKACSDQCYDLSKAVRFAVDELPNDVYISMDLDVMDERYMLTPWKGNGGFTPKQLMKCIRAITARKHVIGVDVLGWSAGAGYLEEVYPTRTTTSIGRRSMRLYDVIAKEIMKLPMSNEEIAWSVIDDR